MGAGAGRHRAELRAAARGIPGGQNCGRHCRARRPARSFTSSSSSSTPAESSSWSATATIPPILLLRLAPLVAVRYPVLQSNLRSGIPSGVFLPRPTQRPPSQSIFGRCSLHILPAITQRHVSGVIQTGGSSTSPPSPSTQNTESAEPPKEIPFTRLG